MKPLSRQELKHNRVGWTNVLILVGAVVVSIGNILLLVEGEDWGEAATPKIVGAMIVAGGSAAVAWASKFIGPRKDGGG